MEQGQGGVMDKKELLAILILVGLVAVVALFRLVRMPPGSEPREKSRKSGLKNAPSRKQPKAVSARLPRMMWPHPRQDYVARDPEANSLFEAAERVMSEAYVAAQGPEPSATLFGTAIPVYQRFLERFPEEPTVEVARFRIAQALTLMNRYAQAAAAYDEFLEQHPASELRPVALLWSGESHLQAGDRETARKRFMELASTGPPLMAEDARRRLGKMEEPTSQSK